MALAKEAFIAKNIDNEVATDVPVDQDPAAVAALAAYEDAARELAPVTQELKRLERLAAPAVDERAHGVQPSISRFERLEAKAKAKVPQSPVLPPEDTSRIFKVA